MVARKLSTGLETPFFTVLNGAEPSYEGALCELMELLQGRDPQVICAMTRLVKATLAEIELLVEQE